MKKKWVPKKSVFASDRHLLRNLRSLKEDGRCVGSFPGCNVYINDHGQFEYGAFGWIGYAKTRGNGMRLAYRIRVKAV